VSCTRQRTRKRKRNLYKYAVSCQPTVNSQGAIFLMFVAFIFETYYKVESRWNAGGKSYPTCKTGRFGVRSSHVELTQSDVNVVWFAFGRECTGLSEHRDDSYLDRVTKARVYAMVWLGLCWSAGRVRDNVPRRKASEQRETNAPPPDLHLKTRKIVQLDKSRDVHQGLNKKVALQNIPVFLEPQSVCWYSFPH